MLAFLPPNNNATFSPVAPPTIFFMAPSKVSLSPVADEAVEANFVTSAACSGDNACVAVESALVLIVPARIEVARLLAAGFI